MSGDEGGKAREARAFGEWLRAATRLPVCYHDERFSTAAASEWLNQAGFNRSRQRQMRDKLAAQIILSSFLEASSDDPPQQLDGPV